MPDALETFRKIARTTKKDHRQIKAINVNFSLLTVREHGILQFSAEQTV